MRRAFWNKKKVLITGHTGFKGSWLSLWLQGAGCEVIGYSLPPPTSPSLLEAAQVDRGMSSIIGDIRDLENLKATVGKEKPEIVFHLAAQALVHYAYHNPIETYTTNVIGTLNVLECVRESESVKVLVCVTSDKCYENKEWLWGYRETDSLGGYDPYSSSKACAELIVSTYRRSFFSGNGRNGSSPAVATARAGNVIGGGDWTQDRLIPDIMRAFLQNETAIIRAPRSTRPWQHVLDSLNGYLQLAQHLWEKGSTFAQAWNFGPDPNDVKSVSWIVDYLSSHWGNGAGWESDPNQHPHESRELRLDASKANNLLGWSPLLDLPRSLNWTIEWYQAYQRNDDIRRLTQDQIERYQDIEGK